MECEDKSYVGMMNCFFCNKPKGVILDRRIRETLPKNAVYDKEPCDECKELMKSGIIIISVRDGESGDNPYRTGFWCVVKEQMIKDLISDEQFKNDILNKRVLFIEDSTVEQIGLKKIAEETKNE